MKAMVAREETYDFQAKENVFKWKEILKVPLEKVFLNLIKLERIRII